MGLDIAVYLNVKENNDLTPDDLEENYKLYDNNHVFYVNEDFPGRNDNIKNDTVYSFDEYYSFRVGSYGYYNWFRNQLASLVVSKDEMDSLGETRFDNFIWENPTPRPFVELINFSDCEGIIGPETSLKLAKDFENFMENTKQVDDEYFEYTYNKFYKAFKDAGENNGVVGFC